MIIENAKRTWHEISLKGFDLSSLEVRTIQLNPREWETKYKTEPENKLTGTV